MMKIVFYFWSNFTSGTDFQTLSGDDLTEIKNTFVCTINVQTELVDYNLYGALTEPS